MAKELSRNHKDLTEDEATVLLTKQLQEHQHHNTGWYRVHAVRGLTGGHRLLPKINTALKQARLIQARGRKSYAERFFGIQWSYVTCHLCSIVIDRY